MTMDKQLHTRTLDIGYGYLKDVSPMGEVIKTRAVVGRLGSTIDPSSRVAADVIMVDGTSYVVGEDVHALGLDEIVANESVGRANSIAYKVLALYSLAKRHNGEPVRVLTGLPFINMSEAQEVKDLLTQTHEVIFNGRAMSITVERTNVVAQGLGTFYTLVKQRGEGILKKRILIVDLGFRTSNYLPINSGEIDSSTVKTTPQLGIQKAYIDLANAINKEFKTAFRYYEVDSLLDGGVPQQSAEEGKYFVDIKDREYVREAFTKYASDVWDDLHMLYSDKFLDALDEIVFAGGTADRTSEYLKASPKKRYCTFMENSQDAQVLGYEDIVTRV